MIRERRPLVSGRGREAPMSREITFCVASHSGFYRLSVADTLCGFIGYDFSYFVDQCANAARGALSDPGRFNFGRSSLLREYIRKCHPYYNALLHSDFSKITLDFIIDFACLSDGIGLEELWTRSISPKDELTRLIFERISEYKTGSAINQWVNLIRMQEYAQTKAMFVFGDGGSAAACRARKRYYDLAFSLSAEKMGCAPDLLPCLRVHSAALIPRASATLTKASRLLDATVGALVEGRSVPGLSKRGDCLHDQMSALVLNAMRDLKRPTPLELKALSEAFGQNPDEVYLPTSFKSILDLEFDRMFELGLLLRLDDGGRFAVFEPPAAPVLFAPSPLEKEPVREAEETPQVAASPGEGTPEVREEDATPPAAPPAPASTPGRSKQDLNVRCQLIQTALFGMVDRDGLPAAEFETWKNTLIGMRRGIFMKAVTSDELSAFLDETERRYQLRVNR